MRKFQTHSTKLRKNGASVRRWAQELDRQNQQAPVPPVTLHVAYRRAQVNRQGLTPADLLTLQRTVVNRQVQRMVARRRFGQRSIERQPSGTSLVQMAPGK